MDAGTARYGEVYIKEGRFGKSMLGELLVFGFLLWLVSICLLLLSPTTTTITPTA